MFTPSVLILIVIIAVLLILNSKLHHALQKAREKSAFWKTRGDNLNSELLELKTDALHSRLSGRMPSVKQPVLESIKFFARVPSYSGHQKTEFKLGLGPCGLVVKTLNVTEQPDRIVIEQLCENGERKTFDYFKSDIQGHIEKRWAA